MVAKTGDHIAPNPFVSGQGLGLCLGFAIIHFVGNGQFVGSKKPEFIAYF